MNSQPWSFLVRSDPDAKRWFADRYTGAIEDRFNRGKRSAASDEPKSRPAKPGSSASRQFKALRYQMAHMHEYPVLLVVCGLRDWPFRVPEEERVGLAPPNYGAVYPCVQNILLACRAVGLGAALTTMHQMFEEEMCDRSNIPPEYGVVVTMPIGFPMGKFGPVRRTPATKVTYYNTWGDTDFSG